MLRELWRKLQESKAPVRFVRRHCRYGRTYTLLIASDAFRAASSSRHCAMPAPSGLGRQRLDRSEPGANGLYSITGHCHGFRCSSWSSSAYSRHHSSQVRACLLAIAGARAAVVVDAVSGVAPPLGAFHRLEQFDCPRRDLQGGLPGDRDALGAAHVPVHPLAVAACPAA